MSRYDIAINKPMQWRNPDGCECIHRCGYGKNTGKCHLISWMMPTPIYMALEKPPPNKEIRVPVMWDIQKKGFTKNLKKDLLYQRRWGSAKVV